MLTLALATILLGSDSQPSIPSDMLTAFRLRYPAFDAVPDARVNYWLDEALLEQADAEIEEERFGKFRNLFPDLADCDQVSAEGNRYRQIGEFKFFSRDYYQRHMDFFTAGKDYRARCLMAANRVGKTMSAGGFEMACHLTGDYPAWWPGKKFRHPIRAWASGTDPISKCVVQDSAMSDAGIQQAISDLGTKWGISVP